MSQDHACLYPFAWVVGTQTANHWGYALTTNEGMASRYFTSSRSARRKNHPCSTRAAAFRLQSNTRTKT